MLFKYIKYIFPNFNKLKQNNNTNNYTLLKYMTSGFNYAWPLICQ